MVLTSSEVIAAGLLANTAGILSSAVRDSQSSWLSRTPRSDRVKAIPSVFRRASTCSTARSEASSSVRSEVSAPRSRASSGKIRLRVGAHEPHVFRVNGGKPFAVRDVEQAADRMFDAVRGGTARVAYGDARERAPQRHPFPCFEIGGVGLYLGQAFAQPEDCLTRIQLAERIGADGEERLDGVGQRVEAGPRDAPAGERGHELRIDDAFLGIQGGQGESLFHMVRVGEHGGPVALAARPRRGGDEQDGQGLPALFAPVDVFEDRRVVVIGEGRCPCLRP